MSGEPSYPLYIITYDRGYYLFNKTVLKPFHWAFYLQTESVPGNGLAFQLRGMPGAFTYSPAQQVKLNESRSKNGEYEIGAVPVSKLERFKQLLEAVPINNVEHSGWNCQDWSLAALNWLRPEGFIGEEWSNEAINEWLKENK